VPVETVAPFFLSLLPLAAVVVSAFLLLMVVLVETEWPILAAWQSRCSDAMPAS
jgi:hypothetical protein